MNKEKKHSTESKKVKVSTLLIGGGLILLVLVGSLVGYTYTSVLDGQTRTGLAKLRMFFLPAMVVDGSTAISFGEVEKNLAAMRKFYETQDYSQVGLRVDFTTEDGKKRLLIKEKELLNKMVEDRFVEILAKKEGIEIGEAELGSSVQAKLDEYGSKDDVTRDLGAHYGWNMEDFKTEIVLPALYRERLTAKIDGQNKADNEKFAEKIKQAQQELKGGADFAQVAKKYSDGSTAADGGELGWVSAAQLEPELANVLFGTKSIERFAIVESSLGFHILDIEEKKKENNEDVLRVRQIFVRKKTFTSWLDQQIKASKVQVLLKGFNWNKATAAVEFSNKDMQQLEQEVMQKSQGDASLLF